MLFRSIFLIFVFSVFSLDVFSMGNSFFGGGRPDPGSRVLFVRTDGAGNKQELRVPQIGNNRQERRRAIALTDSQARSLIERMMKK